MKKLRRTAHGCLFGLAMLVANTAVSDTLRLNILGLNEEQQANVRAYLSIQSMADQPINSESRMRFLHNLAEEEIRKALEPFGYYNPSITVSLNQQDDNWIASYEVDPGPPTLISSADIDIQGEGASDPEFMALLSRQPVREGAQLRHADYEKLKSDLQSIAADRGYYRARFMRQRIEVDPSLNTAVIELHVDTAARARIGEIRFSESPISEKLLRRYPQFSEGDFINTNRLVRLQGALVDSDYFADVEVRPLLNEMVDDRVPIDVKLTSRPRSLYQAGLGYGTDTGARMQFGLTRRWVNSRGHKLDARLRLSQIRNDLSTSYIIPGGNPLTDRYGIRARYSDEDSDTVTSEIFATGVFWQKQVGDWERVLSLDIEQEQFSFNGDTRDIRLLIPRAQWNKTVADDRLNTSHGYRLSFGVSGASDVLLSDVSFLQTTAGIKRVDSFGEKVRLLTRAELGLTVTDSFSNLPASHRFYAGGDSSVRGYSYQSLGPRGTSDNVIGGKYLVVGSVEADYLVRENWRMAAFMDAGNAIDDVSDPLKTSAGVGVRWQSLVGPIRLDLAFPIEDGGWRIHFTLGPDL
ncbi:autotransporter assembly complex protein TamA [Nitrincola sp. MINF-07-Sa-05]|uniref:autotransporter assembly complex protein TamA n=1 Tax=Nitrincola salilacus TaxID=3400273 RepID=UPI003918596F